MEISSFVCEERRFIKYETARYSAKDSVTENGFEPIYNFREQHLSSLLRQSGILTAAAEEAYAFHHVLRSPPLLRDERSHHHHQHKLLNVPN